MAYSRGERRIETRLRANNYQKVELVFTPELELDYNSVEEFSRRRLKNQDAESLHEPKFQVMVFSEEAENVLDSYNIVRITDGGIELQLIFSDPLQVSKGENPDLLLIAMDLSDIRTIEGEQLPSNNIKYMQIPT